MKIALTYPKIPDSTNYLPKKCIAFEKYDGTCIHFLWTPYDGFTDFGTRRDRYSLDNHGIRDFKEAHSGLEDVYDTFYSKMRRPLEDYLFEHYEKSANEIIVFTEFWGKNSFAGNHISDDEKNITIIDVMVDKNVLSPEELIKKFTKHNLAKVIYKGKFTGQFIEDVRHGKYKLDEGVVCKGLHKDQLHMCKIKTNLYMEKLKTSFNDKWEDYWE